MDKDKALVRHDILNIITLLNFQISASRLSESQKGSMLHNLKMVTLLLNFQEVFLNKNRKMMKHETNLDEIVETILMIHEKKFERDGIAIGFIEDNVKVELDRKFFQDALEQVLLEIAKEAKKIEISLEEDTIIFKHDGVKINDKKKKLIDCLANKDDCHDFPYQFGLHLIEMNGAKLTSKKGEVKIKFK